MQIQSILRNRLADVLGKDFARKNSKIIIVNSSIDRIKGLGWNACKLLIQHNFDSLKISTVDDPNKTSNIYAYFRDENQRYALLAVLKIIYPQHSLKWIDITKYDDISNQWIRRKLFDKEGADVVIRMPNPK